MMNVFFGIRLSPLQGLNTNRHSIHSASHYAIAKALSEQQVLNTYDFQSVPAKRILNEPKPLPF